MSNNCAEMVSTSPLVAELNDEQKAILAELVTCRSLADGEILIREGEVNKELHIIATGGLAVTRNTGSGDWVVLHVLRPRDMAGELGFLDDQEHSASLRAVGPTQVFSLSRDKLESLLGSQPEIVYRVMRAIVREVHGILRRMNVQYVELTNYITKQHGRY
ncbi:MAG: cyclic nucleotide-binding domain-containing protein [Gammaproteobacteria bacterium]|nr:cyclic nucleotide-binding domain-containing protein [Gammaproteobacteria bacterium]MBU1647271.1 cyclic nucleotide-binding domain-containing protein [Gammaproteobacteria bacterium]MBU1972783.1 cyclic nucleotide-binding domain-containing protein [Gammaproteobacteria bacterium]